MSRKIKSSLTKASSHKEVVLQDVDLLRYKQIINADRKSAGVRFILLDKMIRNARGADQGWGKVVFTKYAVDIHLVYSGV